VIAEVGLRLVSGKGNPPRSTAIPDRHQAGPGRPDRRNREWPAGKKANTFRIVVVGDSFAWGAGVHAEDAYPDRLEQRLNTIDMKRRFEVVNFSRPGWNTIQAFKGTWRRLRHLEPDLLILTYVLNDAEPSDWNERMRRRRVKLRREPSPGASAWLHRHSLLYRTTWERLENTRQRRAFTAVFFQHYAGESWEECREGLELFQRQADKLGIPLLMLVFPVFDSQIDEGYAYHELHETVATAAGELGIRIFDLRETYRGIDARRLAVTPFTDAHPNELGHRLAADAVLEYLEETDLAPIERRRKRARRKEAP
jgi:lysophospholipase L1-like esterase